MQSKQESLSPTLVPSGSLLDELARGARRMLAAALRAEADAYVDGLVGELDEAGRRLVVRNGHNPVAISCRRWTSLLGTSAGLSPSTIGRLTEQW